MNRSFGLTLHVSARPLNEEFVLVTVQTIYGKHEAVYRDFEAALYGISSHIRGKIKEMVETEQKQ